MVIANTNQPARRWTASELRALPAAERDAILMAAAALAEADYRTDANVTAFEAFGEDDFHGETSLRY
jgi:hypothetical protein